MSGDRGLHVLLHVEEELGPGGGVAFSQKEECLLSVLEKHSR